MPHEPRRSGDLPVSLLASSFCKALAQHIHSHTDPGQEPDDGWWNYEVRTGNVALPLFTTIFLQPCVFISRVNLRKAHGHDGTYGELWRTVPYEDMGAYIPSSATPTFGPPPLYLAVVPSTGCVLCARHGTVSRSGSFPNGLAGAVSPVTPPVS